VANLDENWMRDLHPSLGQQAQSTELGLSQTDIRWIAIILATAIASALVTGLLW
jgi:ABC-type Fe3+-siderophore transport system permease subunit